VEISLNCSGDTFSCDFAFHTVLSVSQVEKLILKEITGLYPNLYVIEWSGAAEFRFV
jgi:hypothetical protein